MTQSAWQEARRCYEAILAAGESPEALEGLSWAAWWLGDSTTVFASRERAFHLYRSGQDVRGAARMALWLSSDYLEFRGESAVANGWRQRARRLLGGLDVTPEHGWLAVVEGDAALLFENDTGVARRAAKEAAEVGRLVDLADLQVMGLAMEGIALVTEGHVLEGMNRLDEAAAGALGGELREVFTPQWALCYLLYACERVRDYDRAAQWCERMREFAERVRFEFGMGICRAHYGAILVWRGKWDEAEAELATAVHLMASRPPAVAEGAVRLADLRRRQGNTEAARRLLSDIEWHPLGALGLAEIALDEGNAGEAADLIDRLLRQLPAENMTERFAAIELLVRVHARLKDVDRAAETLAVLQSIAKAVNTLPLHGAVSFSAGMVASAQGDIDGARRQFEDAVVLFERAGAPYERARARIELAEACAQLGRHSEAARHATGALESLRALGALAQAERAAALLRRLAAPDSGPRDADASGLLTRREQEVLRLVAAGMSDREIAARLILSEHTVHRHIANLMGKLGVPSRAAAVAHAAQQGLL